MMLSRCTRVGGSITWQFSTCIAVKFPYTILLAAWYSFTAVTSNDSPLRSVTHQLRTEPGLCIKPHARAQASTPYPTGRVCHPNLHKNCRPKKETTSALLNTFSSNAFQNNVERFQNIINWCIMRKKIQTRVNILDSIITHRCSCFICHDELTFSNDV